MLRILRRGDALLLLLLLLRLLLEERERAQLWRPADLSEEETADYERRTEMLADKVITAETRGSIAASAFRGETRGVAPMAFELCKE